MCAYVVLFLVGIPNANQQIGILLTIEGHFRCAPDVDPEQFHKTTASIGRVIYPSHLSANARHTTYYTLIVKL
jgi:hypothetical protein